MRMLILTVAMLLLGCAASPAPSAGLIQQPARPTDVRIIDEPEKPTEWGLVVPTWLLAIVTIALCIVTSRSTDKVMQDAADQRRLALEREVNAAAHKLSAEATHVGQLAPTVATAWQQLANLTGRIESQEPAMRRAESDKRVERTVEMARFALAVITSDLASKPNVQLTNEQKRLDEQLAQLEVLKEQMLGERAGLAEDIGFLREKRAMEMQAATWKSSGGFSM